MNKPLLFLSETRNLWVRGSNLTGGHNRLSCPRSADTALKPYLTFLRPSIHGLWIYWLAGSAQQAQQSSHLADGLNPL